MSQPHKNDQHRARLREVIPVKPSHRALPEPHVLRRRIRRQMPASHPKRIAAPPDQQHYHHRRELHDAQRLVARFRNPLDILPPEIQRHQNRKERRRRICIQLVIDMRVRQQFVQHPRKILPRRNAANRPRQHVVKHQRRDRDLRHRPAQRFFHHAVNAAAHKHAAALDIHGAHRVRKHHDRQNEPRRRLPDELLRLAAGVISRRSEVIQDDSRRPPEGNKREHGRRGHNHLS